MVLRNPQREAKPANKSGFTLADNVDVTDNLPLLWNHGFIDHKEIDRLKTGKIFYVKKQIT